MMEEPEMVDGVEYVTGHEQAQQGGEFMSQDLPTLRDQFAMAALTGQLSNPNFDTKATAAELAKTSYGIAAAMLAAREAK